MTNLHRTLPTLVATLGLVLLPQGALHAHAEETPEERCQRETQAYNDAWKRQWSQNHPDAIATGQTPPPPPVPYRCVGTPSITPTSVPTPPAGGTNGASGSVGGGTPIPGHIDPITGLPPNVPPLNQPVTPGSSGYHAGNPPHNTPGKLDYNPTNPWVDGRRTGTPSTPPLNHPTPTNNPHHKQGIDRPNLGNWHPTPPETHPLNHHEKSSGIKNNKHSEATHFWQQLVDNFAPHRHMPPVQENYGSAPVPSVDDTSPVRSATSTDGKRLPAENNTATDPLTLLLMTAGLLSGLRNRSKIKHSSSRPGSFQQYSRNETSTVRKPKYPADVPGKKLPLPDGSTTVARQPMTVSTLTPIEEPPLPDVVSIDSTAPGNTTEWSKQQPLYEPDSQSNDRPIDAKISYRTRVIGARKIGESVVTVNGKKYRKTQYQYRLQYQSIVIVYQTNETSQGAPINPFGTKGEWQDLDDDTYRKFLKNDVPLARY